MPKYPLNRNQAAARKAAPSAAFPAAAPCHHKAVAVLQKGDDAPCANKRPEIRGAYRQSNGIRPLPKLAVPRRLL